MHRRQAQAPSPLQPAHEQHHDIHRKSMEKTFHHAKSPAAEDLTPSSLQQCRQAEVRRLFVYICYSIRRICARAPHVPKAMAMRDESEAGG